MNFSTFWQQSVVVRLVQVICVLVLIAMIVMIIVQLNQGLAVADGKYATKVALQLVPVALWALATGGIFMKKKWAWALLCGIVLLSFLGSVNYMLSRYDSLNPATLVSLLSSAGIIILLNRRDILHSFKTNFVQQKQVPLELTPFAIVCLAGGVFLFMEFFTASRIGPGSLIPKLFISGLGFVFVLLGIGLYRMNKTALQSTQAILIFTFMSAVIIFTRDFFSKRHYFPVSKSLFYIALAAALLFFWRWMLRNRLWGGNEDINE